MLKQAQAELEVFSELFDQVTSDEFRLRVIMEHEPKSYAKFDKAIKKAQQFLLKKTGQAGKKLKIKLPTAEGQE